MNGFDKSVRPNISWYYELCRLFRFSAFVFLIAIIKSMSEQARFLLDDILIKLAPDYRKTEITIFNKWFSRYLCKTRFGSNIARTCSFIEYSYSLSHNQYDVFFVYRPAKICV